MPTTIVSIPVIVSAFTFLAILFLWWGVSLYLRQQAKSRTLKEKVQWGSAGTGGVIAGGPASLANEGPEAQPVLRYISKLGKMVASEKSPEYSRMRINFLKAGFHRLNTVAIFWGMKCLLAACLAVSFILVRVTAFSIFNPVLSLALCLLSAMVGFYLPDLFLNIRIRRRRDGIAKGLPDALDLLVVCVESGMGLDAAINRVSEELRLSNRDFSDELKLYNLELRAGKSRQDALKNLTLRTDVEDLNSLATLLIQAEKFGTGVTQALRVYSDSFRTKRYMKAEEVAAKMPLKLIIVLILCIFPALFVVILGPPFIRLLEVFN
jgi:tight adherence protein C